MTSLQTPLSKALDDTDVFWDFSGTQLRILEDNEVENNVLEQITLTSFASKN